MVEMATYSHTHEFHHPWRVVATAFWDKYPNPSLSHVKDVLVLARHVDGEGKLHSKRLVCVKQEVPRALRPFIADTRLDTYYALETSCVDPANQLLHMETRNVSFSRILDAHSISEYKGSTDGKSTVYTTSSLVKCQLYLVRGRVEETLSQSSLKNSSKAVGVMEEICRRVAENSKPL